MALALPSKTFAQMQAEARLGRPLTTGELAIDIEGADADLGEGKRRLAAAIEKEKRRVVEARLLGRADRMQVTEEVVVTLRWIYNRGRLHALGEMRALGVKPVKRRFYATVPRRVIFSVDKAKGLLGGVQVRLDGEVQKAVEAGQTATRAVEKAIPGALNAAASLVSGAFDAGLADVYEHHADLFSGWQYTAVMDANTCDVCSEYDGRTYDTLQEMYDDLPNFGPNPNCLGGDRCRCRGVPLGPAEGPPPEPTPPTLPVLPTQGISADIGLTPFRVGDDPVGFYDSAKFRQFMDDVNNTADYYGVTVDDVIQTDGVWEGETEPSVSMRVHDGVTGVRAYSSNLGAAYNQDGVLIFDNATQDGALLTFEPVADRQLVFDAMKEVGLEGGRIYEDGTLQIVGAGKDFIDRADALATRLDVHYDAEVGHFDLIDKDGYAQAIRDYEGSPGQRASIERQAGEGEPRGPAGTEGARRRAEVEPELAPPPPLVTSDPRAAMRALAKGTPVQLESADQVATLVEDIAKYGKDAAERGGKVPNFDLGKVTVKNTNLFTVQSKGIPRAEMPQLKGVPKPGSLADKMPRDKRGEVDIAPLFYKRLRDQGVKIDDETIDVSKLKATQDELDGSKVAGIMDYLQGGGKIEGRIPISQDNYIVDGHHRWAADIALDYMKGGTGHITIDVERIDQPILQILREANAFAEEYGIPQQSVFGKTVEQAFRPAIVRDLPEHVFEDTAEAGREAKSVWGADVEQVVNQVGGKIVGAPPVSEFEAAQRLAELKIWEPLATDEQRVHDAVEYEIEATEKEQYDIHESIRDKALHNEWTLLEQDFGDAGLSFKFFLSREGTSVRLKFAFEQGQISDLGDIRDTIGRYNVVTQQQQQQEQAQTPQEPVSPQGVAAPEPAPPVVTPQDIQQKRAFLGEPADAQDTVYLTVPQPPDGHPSGLIRLFKRAGNYIVETAMAGGGWVQAQIPTKILADTRFVSLDEATRVYRSLREHTIG